MIESLQECIANAYNLLVITSGINSLHSTAVNDADNLLASRFPELCEESEALYSLSLALQASVSEESKTEFLEYLDLALSIFRAELASSAPHLKDGTLTAGLLLCTVGVRIGPTVE